MKRFIFFVFILFPVFQLIAQVYDHEWIDHNKQYYKFPVLDSRLWRISKATLVNAGIGEAPAQDFQLWRNGQEVPLFTTQVTGPLAADGFIEFYGERNDGLIDKRMYIKPEFQPSDERSLYSDTAWFYLTLNPGAENARIEQAPNDVLSTLLQPEEYFNTSEELLHNNGYNYGYGETIAGEIYRIPRSSLFDQGEGWIFSEFRYNAPREINFTNLRVHPSSGPIKFSFIAAGYSMATRNMLISLNDSLLEPVSVRGFSQVRKTFDAIPLSRVINDAMKVRFTTEYTEPYWYDNAMLSSIKMSYRKSFHFNNNFLYSFTTGASQEGAHLRIKAFRNENLPAILYDFTNRKRYVSVNKVDSSLFLLQPSASERKLTILNQHPNFLKLVTQLAPIRFTNYLAQDLQAEYIIISNKRLYNYQGHNYVEDYRAYRASAAGGGYNTRVYDVDELADQFAHGQRKSPLAIKNFIRFAVANFSVKPKFVLLLGHGTDYVQNRFARPAGAELLNAVPSYGQPASDNMLASADHLSTVPLVPIGRVSATSGKEIADYLGKLKQYEAVNAPDYPHDRSWKKEVRQLVGGNDPYLTRELVQSMKGNEPLIKDTPVSGKVKTYGRLENPNFGQDIAEVTNRINNGLGLINYLGESSGTSIDFYMDNPDGYTNTNGKYPIFMAAGCVAGYIFSYFDTRMNNPEVTLSENFVLAPNRGSIAFIGNSDWGGVSPPTQFNRFWYEAARGPKFGKSLGEIQQEAIRKNDQIYPNDFSFRSFQFQNFLQQSILHGDPALIPFPGEKPDFFTANELVTVTPQTSSIANDSLTLKILVRNQAKTGKDSVWVRIDREFPDGRKTELARKLLKNMRPTDSLVIKIPVTGWLEKGANFIEATVDPENEWDELNEQNNYARISFVLTDEEIKPVYPYPFAIVNRSSDLYLVGATADPIQDSRTYRLQLDTSEHFNSPILYQKDTTTIGGAVTFRSINFNWQNGRVYYWRLAPVIQGTPVNWQTSSFQYLQGLHSGFGQSHHFQQFKSSFDQIKLDSVTRQFKFGDNTQNLFLVNGIYNYSGFEDSHFNITINGSTNLGGACVGSSIVFNVYDTLSFKPWQNENIKIEINPITKDSAWVGRFGSATICQGRIYNFNFPYAPHTNRKKIMDFLDSIPKGMFVSARLIADPPYDSLKVQYWMRDSAIYGSGKSLYHAFKKQGLHQIDSLMSQIRTFAFVWQKDDTLSFNPADRVSRGLYDRINASVNVPTRDSGGHLLSPLFGPAKKWHEMHWLGQQSNGIMVPSSALLQLIGTNQFGQKTVLRQYLPGQWKPGIQDIDAATYPWLQMKLITENPISPVPYQLNYWRLFFDPEPDGALSGLDGLQMSEPVLVSGRDDFFLDVAFKNISPGLLASTKAKLIIGNNEGVLSTLPIITLKALSPGDTAMISLRLQTHLLNGKYYLELRVNEEKNPVEQHWFNNRLLVPFEVVTALPVNLTNFDAIAEGSQAKLTWQARLEENLDYYEIEHSKSPGQFLPIGRVTAKNQGNQQQAYNWYHNNPVLGNNYYRLKIISKNGSVEYSAIRKVVFVSRSNWNVSPNPFNQIIRIMPAGSPNSVYWTTLFSADGKLMINKKGTGVQTLPVNNLSAGTYYLKITTDAGTEIFKLEKQ